MTSVHDVAIPPPRKLLIVGATSAIAHAFARQRTQGGAVAFVLAGRDKESLKRVGNDLLARGAHSVSYGVGDIGQSDSALELLAQIATSEGPFDEILLAFGMLTDPADTLQTVATMLSVNFVAMALWAEGAARILEDQGAGHLIIIGSVAGDRGRASNYLYGASKSGIETVAQGISLRFHANTALRCTLIKPGLVDSPMTQQMSRQGILWSTPDRIAKEIDRAVARRKDVAYAPAYWRWIMLLIKLMPKALLGRLGV